MADGHLEPDDLRRDAQEAVRDLRRRITHLDDAALDLLFVEARTHHGWSDRDVTEADLKAIYDVVKFGPTSMNGNHGRFIFVRSDEAKARLAKCVNEGNVAKVMTAPVTAIIAYDVEFWRHLARLHPHDDMSHKFIDNEPAARNAAFRNSTLQGAYLMIAARALGFDVGAMSGFSNSAVDEAFLAGTTLQSNFLCNIGYADETALFQRLPRFEFEEFCTIV